MNKKTLIIVLVIIIILCGILYLYLTHNPCKKITDTSKQAKCYTELAAKKQNIELCKLNYHTVDCLKKADPEHKVSKKQVMNLCDLITDTSKSNACVLYVTLNY